MSAAAKSKTEEARRCSEALRDLLTAFRAQMEDALRGTGVTLAQLRLLKEVEENHEASGAALARGCQVTPQTLHAMLTRAEREGWIVRSNANHNQRLITAELTRRGKALLKHGIELREQTEAELWHGVPLAAMRSMRQTLEAGVANLASTRHVR